MLNPDVAAAGVDPAEHYLKFGIHEGRSYRTARAHEGLSAIETGVTAQLPDDFDPDTYLLLHPDVAEAGGDPAEHYVNYGIHEGRSFREERSYTTTYAQDGLSTIHNSDFLQDPAFVRAYSRGLKANQGREFNWHWRVHVGLWAARTAVCLPGDFVECGVNRGFLASAIMEHLDWNRQGRKFWLLDTFGGIDFEGVSAEEGDSAQKDRNERHLKSGFYTSEAESVRENFAEWQNVEIVVGAVPGTLEHITSEQIAFASIDMNTAAPEIAAMKFLWPRLVPGAMIVLDDYAYHGYLPQKHAMDAFAREYGTSVLSLPTGQGLIIRPPER